MADLMNTTTFKSVVEPIMSKAFDGVYDIRDDEWRGYMSEEQGIERQYQEEPVLSGFGPAPEMPEGSPVVYDAGQTFYIQRYYFKVFGLAFALTKVLVEDGDHIRIGKIYSQHLAQSVLETKETNCANVLNRSFNAAFPGGDQVSLVNPTHPIIGGTFSNILATPAALSQSSVEQMLIQIRKAVDDRGKPIKLKAKKLLVSPDNMMQAEVVLKSILRSGGANNDVNPIRTTNSLPDGVEVISRLTSTTAWWMKTNARDGLKLLMRRSIVRSMEGDFETDSMRYKATERYIPGWTNPRTVFGTQGL